MSNGKTHYKWQFSIAMLVYQRVNQPTQLGAYLGALTRGAHEEKLDQFAEPGGLNFCAPRGAHHGSAVVAGDNKELELSCRNMEHK